MVKDMGLRLFTAVLPPADVVTALDALLEPRRAVDSGLRWTRPEGWHLTTAFMADVDPGLLDRLEIALGEVAARTASFRLGLTGGVAFPHPIKARVLAMAVGAGGDQLAELSARCRAAAARSAAAPDNTKFVGHLTLARHNRGFQATKWLGVLDSFPEWTWQVSELCLIQSRLGRGYEVLERFALTDQE